MNAIHTRFGWLSIAAIGLGMGLATPAGAAEGVRLQGNVVLVGDDEPWASEESSVVILGADGDEAHSVEVHVEDGEVHVKIDGEEISTDRLTLKDGRIYILQDDGTEEPLSGVFVGPDGGFGTAWGLGLGDRDFQWFGPGGGAWEHPKVFLGVTMGEPGEALEHHLHLEPGQTTMINGIYEGFAAHDGGLRRYDIITAVDGNTPAAPGDIREALSEKEPGDTVTFNVIQEGRKRSVTITLEAFDEERWREVQPFGPGPRGNVFVGPEGMKLRLGPEHLRDFFVDPEGARIFRWDREQPGELRDFFEQLDKLNEPEGEMSDRLERLNERLAEMQRMLDDLVEQSRDMRRRGRN
jgi:hypothetical protein